MTHRYINLLYSNDPGVVTPTTEVVKEESIADWLERKGMPKLSEEDYQTNLESLTGSCSLSVEESAEEEPQTGWRFLGFENSPFSCKGKFTVGKIYQCLGPGQNPSNLVFVDDAGIKMRESHKCFEQVK